ncbi:MAG: asparaginase [Rubrobacteraceae bacterium]
MGDPGAQANTGRKPKVVLLTTGGTISSRPTSSGGVVAAADGEEVLSTVRGLESVADVRAEDLFKIGAYLMTPEKMLEVAQRVRELGSDPDLSGVVVTHGTDTMEETAYLVDLLYTGDAPVVFTGAQRNAAEPDTDGPRNLRDALRLAAEPGARGLGGVIVMGGSIEGAREATKAHTTSQRAFASPGYGPVGAVTDDGVHVFHPRARPSNLVHEPSSLPRVDLIKLAAGTDGAFLRASREAGSSGIVLEAFGLGNANHEVLAEVEESLRNGISVIVVSRCPEGRAAPVYGNGGGYDLREAGAVFGGSLTGQKARLLLMVGLSATAKTGASLDTLLGPHLDL